MRITVRSEIHGNSPALDAVLREVTAPGGADGYWVVGVSVGSRAKASP